LLKILNRRKKCISVTGAVPKLFNALEFNKMSDKDIDVSRPTDNPVLLPYNRSAIDEFNYSVYLIKTINDANIRDAKKLMKQAADLSTLLKKEYHLQ